MAESLPGRAVGEGEHPRLRALVARVSELTGVDAPGQIRFVPDLNAYAAEVRRFFRAPERVVVLGMATLSLLEEQHFAAVLAHELAHLRLGDAGLGASRQLARVVFGRARDALAGGLTAPLAKAAAEGLLATEASARASELAADALAARALGRRPIREAVVRASFGAPLFERFLQREVAPLLELGRYPKNLYDGFRRYLDAAGQDPFAEHVAALLRSRGTGDLDTHPALVARLAHLEGLEVEEDRTEALGLGGGLARALLDRADEEEEATTRAFAESLPLPVAPAPVAWDDVGEEVLRPWLARRAEQLTSLATAALGLEDARPSAVLHALLLRLDDVGPPSLARTLDPAAAAVDDLTAAELLAGALGQLFAAVLLERGGQIEHRVGLPLVVERGGERTEPLPLVAAALDDAAARAALLAAL